jgi:hypothetical protein
MMVNIEPQSVSSLYNIHLGQIYGIKTFIPKFSLFDGTEIYHLIINRHVVILLQSNSGQVSGYLPKNGAPVPIAMDNCLDKEQVESAIP